jgi:hypothetical protein
VTDIAEGTSSRNKKSSKKSKNYVCKDQEAINYEAEGLHKQSLCEYKDEEEKGDDDNDDKKEKLKKKIEEQKKKIREILDKKKVKPTVTDQGLCKPYIKIDSYMRIGKDNNSEEVKKLQEYLNQNEGENLEINGTFDKVTEGVVKRYQEKYKRDILLP